VTEPASSDEPAPNGEPQPADDAADESGEGWLNQKERGQVWMMQAMFRLASFVGRRPTRPVVSCVALWYRLFDRHAVAASRDWLARVHGRQPGFWEIYRHLRAFAQTILDKVFFITGNTKGLVITNPGGELLDVQSATGRGAVLLGSHLGSYDAMRAVGMAKSLKVQILGYFENAAMINSLLQKLNPGLAERVIHLGDDPVGVMARVRARLDVGELVAVAGDRVGLNDRIVTVKFMGQEASFASGPFLLASVLRCPVYLVFGIYTEPNGYDLTCELFAERIELPRANREEALQAWVQRFADCLEVRARQAPNNWFNFYDFWSAK
jgi:predicted LPLAT superfamily acyltransferase